AGLEQAVADLDHKVVPVGPAAVLDVGAEAPSRVLAECCLVVHASTVSEPQVRRRPTIGRDPARPSAERCRPSDGARTTESGRGSPSLQAERASLHDTAAVHGHSGSRRTCPGHRPAPGFGASPQPPRLTNVTA